MTRFVKNPDEIVLNDVKMVHYETMEEGRAVWLGIYLNNGKMYHLNIGGDNLYVNYSYEERLIKMTEWFSDAYWHWRNVFYFRFREYNDDIDRGAFFEELNYGWLQMYSGMWDDPIPEGVDPYNLRGRS